jgi:hypothetical protein
MTESSGGNYALGRLVLDYIKAFLWPVVAIIIVLIYQEDVRRILSEREVDIFGLRIGEKVEQIETQAMAEIEDIRVLLEAQKQAAETAAAPDPQLTADIDTKLSSLERNLSREISQVQSTQQTVQAAPPAQRTATLDAASSRTARAQAAERRGFEALIARDFATALGAFDEARSIWPEYHNVAELGRALRNRQDQLRDPDASAAWQQLYREILTRYSWGLPEDLRSAIRAEATKAL